MAWWKVPNDETEFLQALIELTVNQTNDNSTAALRHFLKVFSDQLGLCSKTNVKLELEERVQPVFCSKLLVSYAMYNAVDPALDLHHHYGRLFHMDHDGWSPEGSIGISIQTNIRLHCHTSSSPGCEHPSAKSICPTPSYKGSTNSTARCSRSHESWLLLLQDSERNSQGNLQKEVREEYPGITPFRGIFRWNFWRNLQTEFPDELLNHFPQKLTIFFFGIIQ